MKDHNGDSEETACSDALGERDREARRAAVARFRRRRAKMKRIKMSTEEILAAIREGRR